MSHPAPTGYSLAQITLHWIIAAIVFFQLAFGESMAHAVKAREEGGTPAGADGALASAHYWLGIAVLALVALRLALRVARGVPAPVDEGLTGKLAAGMHHLFYLLLVAAPVTGLLGFYAGEPWGGVHTVAKPLFIVLILGHAGAALFHAFWLHDGTLRRMLVPQRG
ncbi:cytochrome b [Pseudochelatococcus lubricantis]|uniref:cytochrome b n=1 Tax=Pseudochelatococcus lubricantis TaxID=1538102 RepID=UPI0035E709C2